MDAGHVAIYEIQNIAQNGEMPKESPVFLCEEDFEELQIGVTRQYLAIGVNQRIDARIRIWRESSIRIGMIAVITESEFDGQYRIDDVTNSKYVDSVYNKRTSNNGLKTTDLTLSKLEQNYDIDFN